MIGIWHTSHQEVIKAAKKRETANRPDERDIPEANHWGLQHGAMGALCPPNVQGNLPAMSNGLPINTPTL